ncbi:hypothetical protein OUZ56_008077 [Daphnia magna]|uniref:Uncharacterized protein n=1 Tax=Daphnia magna TaxID=35525 RepID=A0ABR0AC06_9CRUS|nr:hypothetical protein OUZ56_008077 [Daphnia magna]
MQSLALLRKARQKSETLRWGRLQVAIRRRTNIEPTARDRSDYERSKRAKTKGMPPILSDLSQVFLYCLYTSTFTKIERRLNSTTCVSTERKTSETELPARPLAQKAENSLKGFECQVMCPPFLSLKVESSLPRHPHGAVAFWLRTILF